MKCLKSKCKPPVRNFTVSVCIRVTNLLLTEREGRTREYWPEVVTVRPKTTEGQYYPVRLEKARLVSTLLYGTLFLIVKCTSGGLHLKCSSSSSIFEISEKFQSFQLLLIVST